MAGCFCMPMASHWPSKRYTFYKHNEASDTAMPTHRLSRRVQATVGAGRLDVIAAAAPADEPSSAAACAAEEGPSAESVACLRWEGRLGDGCERGDVHRLGLAMKDVDECHLKVSNNAHQHAHTERERCIAFDLQAVPGEKPTLSMEVSGKDGHPMFVSLVFGGEPTCEAGRQEKDPSQTSSKVYRM